MLEAAALVAQTAALAESIAEEVELRATGVATAHDITATAVRPVVIKAAKAKVDCMWKR